MDHYEISVVGVALHLCAVVLGVDKHDSVVSLRMIHVDFNCTIVCNQSLSRLVTFLIENSKIIPNNRIIGLKGLSFNDRIKRPSVVALLVKQDGLRDQVDLLRGRLLDGEVIIFEGFMKFVEAVIASCFDVERVGIIFLSLLSL